MKKFLFAFLCCLSALVVQAQENSLENGFLVKPYLQFATQNSIIVLWETKEEATTKVNYGEARLGDQAPNLSQEKILDGNRSMHEVPLTELKMETNYFWQVTSITASGDSIQSQVYSFKTAVADNQSFLFALVGDSQRNNDNPLVWGEIAEKVWQDRPSFVVHAGDLVDKGSVKTDWTEHFFPLGHVLMRRFPMYTVLGNHEQDDDNYYKYMANPAPEYYYTFNYGNAQFFMIDTNKDVSENSEQYNWLEWALAKSTATWKIVVHHHPPYSSEADDHGNTFKAASTYGTDARNLVPLYEAYGVDFCLFGHTHVYERSWPIKENMINQKEGVVYINSGGAGGFIEDFAPTRSWFTLELQTGHHYCTFAIFEKTLVFKAIDQEGRLFDSFQMDKEEKGQDVATVVQPPAPHIIASDRVFEKTTNVSMEAAFEDLEIRYTTDGSEPSRSSSKYSSELTLDRSMELQARAYTKDGRASRVIGASFKQMDPTPAQKIKNTEAGLAFKYYEGDYRRLPDFSKLTPVKEGVSKQLGLEEIGHREDRFAVVFEGYVDLPETGIYNLYINSDDGSKLYINDELLVDHDGDHSAIKKSAKTILAKGKHKIKIEYFERGGSQVLSAGMLDKDLGVLPFTPFQLSH